MKNLVLLVLAIFLLTGCATTRITTDIGVMIGDSFQESAEKGMISAEVSIQAWPYVSGQIKGLLAGNYDLDMIPLATKIIKELDKLAQKKELTTEEKGFVIGSFVRLEAIAIEQGWSKYGVSIMSLIMKSMGG